MNKNKKILSAFIAAIMILLSFASVAVSAEAEFNIKIGLDAKASVENGKILYVSLMLDFNEDDAVVADGIRTMSYLISFDTNYFEAVDPKTGSTLETDEFGEATNGSFYNFGEIGDAESMLVSRNSKGDTLSVLYGGIGDDNDVYTPGELFELAFKVKDDIEIKNSVTASFNISKPEVFVKNSETKVNIETESINVSIVPQFKVFDIPSQKQNTTLDLAAQTSISANSTEPLIASIQKDGETVEEKNAEIKNGLYSVSFSLDESMYPVGTYTLVLTYGTTSASRSFSILEKDKTPEPAEPADPKPDTPTDSGDTKKDDNNTGGGTHSDGNKNNGTSNTGSTTTPTKPSNTADSGNKPQTTVKYPSDLAGHWAESNVKYVYDNALMNGYSDGTFKPDASITRAEFSAVMARFLKLDDKAAATEKFGDVKGHWAIGYIGALADKGIVGGVTEDAFAPDDNITREQMAAILARAFELKETSPELFADNGEISDWAHDYVYACRKAGYMTGDAANNFSPLDNASRAEVATVIYRLHSAK